MSADVVIIGGGLGGVAAALSAAEAGLAVVLTEETDWLGGQATAQGVPLDEHPWIERFGCTAKYRVLRDGIRRYYRDWYPLRAQSRRHRELNPGTGLVGFLCAEPRVMLAVIEAQLAPYVSSGRLRILLRHRAIAAHVEGDRIVSVELRDQGDGEVFTVSGRYFIDATEIGDLLPLSEAEYVTGSEAKSETGEEHADSTARPLNMQAFTVCFAMDYIEGTDHTIDRPRDYDYWREYKPEFWPGPQLGWLYPHNRTREPRLAQFAPNSEVDPLDVVVDMRQTSGVGAAERFGHRRIVARKHFDSFYASDITIVNWPMTDYLGGPLFGESEEEGIKHLEHARQQSLSFLYWMQTEAPNDTGGQGYPGLRLPPDVLGTKDGLAKYPYIRESRRMRTEYVMVEHDLTVIDGDRSPHRFPDSIGIGAYRLDLHPTCGGDNFFDVACRPFEIPLRCLIPVRLRNLLPGGKSVGSTHIANGALRLHDTEWNIGEVAGSLAAHCIERSFEPHQVSASPDKVEEFQARLDRAGVERSWPVVEAY
jgi:hypothetical protein